MTLLAALALAPTTARAAPPDHASGPRPADDFRRSDPRERALDPAAESSGLRRETSVQDRTEILDLDDVLGSLVASDPRLDAAEHRREIAEAELLSARGGFDTQTRMRGFMQPLSYYRQGTFDVRVQQPTPLWGVGVFAGWRIGLGDFAVYDGKLLTAAGGEVRAGATIPLWRDGPIDRRRADLRQAKIGTDKAARERDAKQLELEAKAAAAYWDWVAAGLELEIERELLEVALERDTGLRRKIELGDLEAIVGTDNRRQILSREARVVSAEREFQAAALSLSLYLRDTSGVGVVAGADRLPLAFPTAASPSVVDIDAEIEAALKRRPDLAALEAARAQIEIEVRWAKNQRAPRIDVSAWVAQDLGPGDASLTPFELAAVVDVEIPIPMRRARGQYRAAKADLARIDAELRFARDSIAAQIRDAHSAVAAAYQGAQLAGEQVELARDLALAELRRFELGAGDLLLVNLREVAVADAQRAEVEALATYFEALAKLEIALGRSLADQ